MIAVLVAVAAIGVDARVELVTLKQEQKTHAAAKLAERLLAEAPDEARELGIEYLLAHLLEELGHRREAVASYARVMRTSPVLRPYALVRAAAVQIDLGHPELSSGLLASLLEGDPPAALVPAAERLLVRALQQGGDCRLLEDLGLDAVPASTRRRLVLLRSDCSRRSDAERASELLDLLREDGTDLAASLAAATLARIPDLSLDAEASAVLGASLHHHREFELAAKYLEKAADALPRELERRADIDTLYLLVRSWFWQGELARAAAGFGDLAERTRRPEDRGRALFQQGRCFELRGEWAAAAASYRRAYLADPTGRWSAASLISAMRVEWRTGREEAAIEVLELLPTRSDWRDESARAALYLASSELVRGRADRAGRWLRQAELAVGRDSVELLYWRGRHGEVGSDPDGAVAHYLDAVGIDPYHPLATLAGERLRSVELRARADSAAMARSRSHRVRDLAAAWRHLGEDHASGAAARSRLLERALAHRPFRDLGSPVPVSRWPIWQADLTTAEETLLALGLWGPGAGAVLEHFPPSQPALALVASEGLLRDGSVRRSTYVAEVLADRLGEVPEPLWPGTLRLHLYPLPYEEVVRRAAHERGVDPALILALLREESRFDPEAISVASARGMAQFVFPTARPLASRAGLRRISPQDLEDPVLSIELAAAYLGELLERFDGSIPEAIAAYNAGDRQVALWRAHCYGRDSAEFMSKIGFPETRAYVARVLGAQARYREIHETELAAAPPPPRDQPAARAPRELPSADARAPADRRSARDAAR